MIVIVGSANAVNLTDGLDGLAIMPVIIAGASLGIISYIVGRADYSSYLDIHYIKGSGEILIFSAALIGSGLGFCGTMRLLRQFLWETQGLYLLAQLLVV